MELLTRNVESTPDHVINDCIIRDNGIGMSSEFQKHMFEPFAQESTNIESEYQGTGLGLPIVRKLVDVMGGEMTVKSTLNEGTAFRIRSRSLSPLRTVYRKNIRPLLQMLCAARTYCW